MMLKYSNSIGSDSEGRKQMFPFEEEETVVLERTALTNEDFQIALDKLQAAHSDAIGAPKVRTITPTRQ